VLILYRVTVVVMSGVQRTTLLRVSPIPVSGCGYKKHVNVTRVKTVIDGDDLLLGSSPYSPDAPRPYKVPFVPHNLISAQCSPVPC
jgi:hypothetical protein